MSILKLIFSRSRWEKLNTLRRELQQLIIHRNATSSDHTTPRITTRHWKYKSEIQVPAEIYMQDSKNSQQDRPSETGNILTEHNYQISRIVNAFVSSNNINHSSIYDCNGLSLPELSFTKSRKFTQKKLRQPVTRKVPGLSASLFGTVAIASGNYGHWMIDGLPRLLLIKQTIDLDEIDFVATPNLRFDFQQESLLLLGFSQLKTIEIPALECFRFEELVCTSSPRGTSSTICPGWIIDEYRDIIRQQNRQTVGKKRLFISRKDASSRNLINEEETLQVLQKYGFESVQLSDYNFLDKISLFQDAECVIGLTGAGLTNIMFCSRETKILELFPPDFVHYLYASIASHLGLDYQYLRLKNASALNRLNKYFGDLYLDTVKLETALRQFKL